MGLEPSRAAKFSSAPSSLTMFLRLAYVCVRVTEPVETVRRFRVLAFQSHELAFSVFIIIVSRENERIN